MAPKAVRGQAKAEPKAKAKAAPKAKAAAARETAAPALKRKGSSQAVESPAPKLARSKSAESVGAAKVARSKSSENVGGAAKRSTSSRKMPVDRCVPARDAYSVYEDYNTKLNQTNIGGNNNKFYVIQVLQKGGDFFAWNRWGRVGEDGQNKLEPHGSNVAAAIKSFEKKFQDKSSNQWCNRASFVAKSGKYTLVEMDETEDAGGESAPLGKLSKSQIEKGMGVLSQLDGKISSGAPLSVLQDLSSQFFSLIPTNFGRKVPEPITTENKLREKEELLKFWLRMGFEEVEKDDGLTPIQGIMDLPVPETLQKAAGSVCAKGSIDSSTRQGETLAKKQAGSPVKSMVAALYAAIMLYTSNAIYAQLNKALREQNRAAVKKYFSYLRLLFEAMVHLPQKKRTLWRGIPADLHDQYTVGSTQTWWNVSSCTSDINVAKNFMKGCGGKCTLLTVESTSACDISDITFYSNEKESLLAPGTQLKVKSRSRSGNTTEITLVEVGRCIS